MQYKIYYFPLNVYYINTLLKQLLIILVSFHYLPFALICMQLCLVIPEKSSLLYSMLHPTFTHKQASLTPEIQITDVLEAYSNDPHFLELTESLSYEQQKLFISTHTQMSSRRRALLPVIPFVSTTCGIYIQFESPQMFDQVTSLPHVLQLFYLKSFYQFCMFLL